MAKKSTFAKELTTISNSVEADVGRVINMLRDGSGQRSADGDDWNDPSNRQNTRTNKIASQRESVQRRPEDKPRIDSNSIDQSSNDARTLENVTTRLTRKTNQSLTEATLRQRLAKHTPDSRQAIIEEALIDWLQRNGYA